MAARLRLSLLGPMRAEAANGCSVLPRMRKTRALLAVLGLAGGRPVARSHLATLLWSRRGPDQARASLRQATHELHSALGSVAQVLLRTERNQITLMKHGLWVDALAVTDPQTAPRAMLELFRGPLLEDLRGLDPALDSHVADEHQRLIQIARAIGEGLLAECVDPDDLQQMAQRLLDLDVAHHAAWLACISAHLRRGDRSAALTVLGRYRTTLASVGGEPESRAIDELFAPSDEPEFAGHATTTRRIPIASPDVHHATPQSSGDRPRLAVLPLHPHEPRRDGGLAAGLTEEIITAFTRFRWMSCVTAPLLTVALGEGARNSTSCRHLDADFILEGSVQRSGDRARVIITLSHVRVGGGVVWSRRFDRDAVDMLAAQESIAAEVVAQIDLALLMRETERRPPLRSAATESSALLLRAISGIYRLEAAGFQAAGEMLEEVLTADPENAAAHAWSAYWHLLLVGQGWATDARGSASCAMERAQRAVILDPTDARALTLAGHIHGFLGKRPREAEALHERAIALNPNLPLAWCFSGLAHSYLGNDEEAIRRLRYAHQLSPHDPHSFFFDTAMIMPFIVRGEYDSALELGRRAIALNPGFSSAYKVCLSALGHLHRSDDAADIRARLLALEPNFSVTDAIARSPMIRSEDIVRYADGLRRAGLPE